MPSIQVAEITVEVTYKPIKNIHLSVHPPIGEVTLSVPEKYDLDTLRMYVISRLDWLRERIEKFKNQERESPRSFISNESHYFFGERYKLFIEASTSGHFIERKADKLVLHIRPEAPTEKRATVFSEWYRVELKTLMDQLIKKWEPILGVKVKEFGVKKMKTKWGTCNSEAGRIWLNLELAKKPIHCIEYIVVHEMVHLLEKSHNKRFIALLDHYMPNWRMLKDELNRLPLNEY
jgi:predicted metal-dependent hydrolase